MSNVANVVIGTLTAFYHDVKLRLADLTDEQIDQRPAPGLNPIGFTVWHAVRGLDMLLGQINGKGADGEVWNTSSFAQVTGYDPRGKGFRGLGIGTGYTRAMVDAAPANRYLLIAYVDAVATALIYQIRALGEEGLRRTVEAPQDPHDPPVTLGQRILALISHGYRHLGEADVLASLHGVPNQTTPREEA